MNVLIWSKPQCSQCDQAKALLQQKNIDYTEQVIGVSYTKEDLLKMVPNAKTLPQIFIDGKYIGGLSELKTYL